MNQNASWYTPTRSMYDVRGLPSPYPGLRSFGYDDSPCYAGRKALVLDAVKALVRSQDSQHLLFVTGPSGSGKTSFVQAGLLPVIEAFYARFHQPVRWTIIRPGCRPVVELSYALQQFGYLGAHGELLPGASLRQSQTQKRTDHIDLLVIDQLEELFTQSDPVERDVVLALWPKRNSTPPARWRAKCSFTLRNPLRRKGTMTWHWR